MLLWTVYFFSLSSTVQSFSSISCILKCWICLWSWYGLSISYVWCLYLSSWDYLPTFVLNRCWHQTWMKGELHVSSEEDSPMNVWGETTKMLLKKKSIKNKEINPNQCIANTITYFILRNLNDVFLKKCIAFVIFKIFWWRIVNCYLKRV